MDIRPDIRKFEDEDQSHGSCRKCGRPLELLPDDMRLGYCFDCIDFLELSRRTEFNQGRMFNVNVPNPFTR